jgi:arylformamidase
VLIDPELDREYSPSSRVGGSSAPFIADYERTSQEAVTAMHEHHLEVLRLPGGSLAVAPAPGAPTLVFVHGGYWQALSAAASMYPAPALVARGWGFLAVEYTLAPHASLTTMVDETRTALAEFHAAVPQHGDLVVAGHSAGGHLVAMSTLAHEAPVPVQRVVLVSGVYDLRPLVHTSVNTVLGLTAVEAGALSPALMPVRAADGAPAVVVTWGDNETDAFKAQSHAYAERLRAAGLSVHEHECVDRNHFDIVYDLAEPATPLGALTLAD